MIRRAQPYRDLKLTGSDASSRVAKLRYYETYQSTGAAFATCLYRYWRLNSIYDPNYSGTGHQPYGTAQLETFWTRYRVIGCAYHVRYRIVESTPNSYDDVMCATQLHETGNYPVDVTSFSPLSVEVIHQESLGNVQYKHLPHPTYAGGKVGRVLKGFARIKNFMMPHDWDQNWSTFSANPTVPIYLTTFLYRKDGATFLDTDFQYAMEVTLRFIVQVNYKKQVPAT